MKEKKESFLLAFLEVPNKLSFLSIDEFVMLFFFLPPNMPFFLPHFSQGLIKIGLGCMAFARDENLWNMKGFYCLSSNFCLLTVDSHYF